MNKDFEVHTLEEPPLSVGQARPIEYQIDPQTDCWNVVNRVSTTAGYYQVIRNNQRMMIHRYSYKLAKGKIPVHKSYHGFCVCHRCDNRACINPAHLFLGTHEDNLQDAARKGRIVHGERHCRHKLVEVKVRAILQDKITPARELAKINGVTLGTIYHIKTGRTWKYLRI